MPAHELRHETTQDVDAIIPLAQLDPLRADAQFWSANDRRRRKNARCSPVELGP